MEIRAMSICTVDHLLLPLPLPLIQSVRMRVRRILGIFEISTPKTPASANSESRSCNTSEFQSLPPTKPYIQSTPPTPAKITKAVSNTSLDPRAEMLLFAVLDLATQEPPFAVCEAPAVILTSYW